MVLMVTGRPEVLGNDKENLNGFLAKFARLAEAELSI